MDFKGMNIMNRIDLLKTYLARKPDDSFLKHALALEYVKLHRDEEAIALFEELLAHDPDYAGSYYHLGKARERAGDNERALDTYRRGMLAAGKTGEERLYRELQQAADDIL